MNPSHEVRSHLEERGEKELEQLRAENIRLRERLAQLERYADDAVARVCELDQARRALLNPVRLDCQP